MMLAPELRLLVRLEEPAHELGRRVLAERPHRRLGALDAVHHVRESPGGAPRSAPGRSRSRASSPSCRRCGRASVAAGARPARRRPGRSRPPRGTSQEPVAQRSEVPRVVVLRHDDPHGPVLRGLQLPEGHEVARPADVDGLRPRRNRESGSDLGGHVARRDAQIVPVDVDAVARLEACDETALGITEDHPLRRIVGLVASRHVRQGIDRRGEQGHARHSDEVTGRVLHRLLDRDHDPLLLLGQRLIVLRPRGIAPDGSSVGGLRHGRHERRVRRGNRRPRGQARRARTGAPVPRPIAFLRDELPVLL